MTTPEILQRQMILADIKASKPLTKENLFGQIQGWYFLGDLDKATEFCVKHRDAVAMLYGKLESNRSSQKDYRAKIAPEFYWRQRLKNLIVDENNSRLLKEAENIFEELV